MRNNSKGFSLIEVLIAVLVLGIGGLSTIHLLSTLTRANRSLGSQTDGIGLATQLLAEVSNARFISPADRDPGLAVGTYVAPFPASMIQSVGFFENGRPTPLGAPGGAYSVQYRVEDCLQCGVLGGAGQPGGVEVEITVANTIFAGRDDGHMHGGLLRPIRMAIRREYTPAQVPTAQVRGF